MPELDRHLWIWNAALPAQPCVHFVFICKSQTSDAVDMRPNIWPFMCSDCVNQSRLLSIAIALGLSCCCFARLSAHSLRPLHSIISDLPQFHSFTLQTDVLRTYDQHKRDTANATSTSLKLHVKFRKTIKWGVEKVEIAAAGQHQQQLRIKKVRQKIHVH